MPRAIHPPITRTQIRVASGIAGVVVLVVIGASMAAGDWLGAVRWLGAVAVIGCLQLIVTGYAVDFYDKDQQQYRHKQRKLRRRARTKARVDAMIGQVERFKNEG